MIWATVSSQSCFCWLYRASPSLAAKNIISLISVLTIWWCPCIESCVVGRGCLLRPVRSLVKILLLSASFCTPRSNLPVYSRYFFFFFFFNFTILYWFCHTSTWICHRCTRVPHPESPSRFPPHTIPLGHPSAPAPTPGISWLPTFAFQSPLMQRTSFLGVVVYW